MKSVPFAYARPGSVDDVLDELGREGAKVIAGGQSLVPVLAMRLARPTVLVDINAVEELSTLSAESDGLRVGATVRQRAVQRDVKVERVPLLGMALPWVGHREMRSRGTVCGSLAHADPAAELPAVACCLGATITVAGAGGERNVPASEFFVAAMTTAIQPEELVTSVHFPFATRGQGFAFAEIARRLGDFALAGVAVMVDASAPLHPVARVVCFGVSDKPVVRDVSAWLESAIALDGEVTTETVIRESLSMGSADFAAGVVDTVGDTSGSTPYRRRLISTLVSRELARGYVRSTQSELGTL